MKLVPVLLGCLAFGFAGDVAAQKHDHGDLATKATNPVGAMIQLQLQDTITPSSENADGAANSGFVQPVIPFDLPKGSYFQNIITRTTIPVAVTTADPAGPARRTTGTGDTVLLASPTHTTPGKIKGEFVTWGPIGTITFPTATQDETGSGKFTAGPGAIVISNHTKVFRDDDSLMVGGFGYQQWSFAGEGSRIDVSKFFAAPLLVYHFSLFDQKGWYGGLPDDFWIYDFKRDDFTQIPLGLRFGKVISIGKQPANLFLQSWYNAADENSSQYTIKLNFTFLFPK